MSARPEPDALTIARQAGERDATLALRRIATWEPARTDGPGSAPAAAAFYECRRIARAAVDAAALAAVSVEPPPSLAAVIRWLRGRTDFATSDGEADACQTAAAALAREFGDGLPPVADPSGQPEYEYRVVRNDGTLLQHAADADDARQRAQWFADARGERARRRGPWERLDVPDTTGGTT